VVEKRTVAAVRPPLRRDSAKSSPPIQSTTVQQHTQVEWLAFLEKIRRQTPAELDLHLIVDNYATHKHPVVLPRLEKHPRIHLYFTPTGSSWLNLVDRFFRQMTTTLSTGAALPAQITTLM